MENLKKIFEWTKKLPIWLRAIVYLMTAVLVLIASLSLSACGATTKATIRNFADSTSTTVTITTNNPTDWNVTPNVQLPNK